MNQGQACESGSRLFLHRDIHDAFLKELKAEFERIRVGDPLDPNTQMGTQVSQAQMDTILGYVELAKKEGATILTGGERITGEGFDDGFLFAQPLLSMPQTKCVSHVKKFLALYYV